MNASNRSQLRLFLLIAAIVVAVVLWRARPAKANPGPLVDAKHLFLILGKPAQVVVPGADEPVELPVGSYFGGDEYRYDFDGRITRIVVEASIFDDGFDE